MDAGWRRHQPFTAIRAGQAWMDAMNNASSLQCRLGERIGMALLQAGRPVAVAAAAKGVGKRLVPPAASWERIIVFLPRLLPS